MALTRPILDNELKIAKLTELDVPSLLNQRVAKVIVRSRADLDFIYYVLQTRHFVDSMNEAMAGTDPPNIGSKALGRIPIAAPVTVDEQRAIATALSDIDTLISTLDQLIAKKRNLKQAAMQQLLTGKTRLPGFNGEWEVKQLGDIGRTYGGLIGKTKSDFGDGSARYITFLNILNNVVIDPEQLEQVKVRSSEKQNQVLKGDLFFNGSSETPEEVGMCSVLLTDVYNVFLNSFCFGFRMRESVKVNVVYLVYFFRSHVGRELIYYLAQGATRYNLSKTNLLKLSFKIPELAEQTAIAVVLSDMDAEIAALERRRDKTRSLKQGMMQQLLTGRIRLVGKGA
jgi:type I restriction enzyme S subunit